MSSDIEEFDEQIVELITSIKNTLEKDMPSLKGQERVEKCNYLRNRLNRAKQVHRSILVEARSLAASESARWTAKAKEYEDQIARLNQDINWAEANNAGKAVSPKKHVDEMQTNEITKHALMVQDKTQQAAARAQQAIEETIQIGISANTELKQQGEKLKEVEQGLDQIESNLKRADKQVRIFVRRLASDRIFLFLLTMMALGITGAITVYILKKTCPHFVQGTLC